MDWRMTGATQAIAAQVSDAAQLKAGANVTTSGAPKHTPDVAAQTCKDVATGNVYEWWDGAWHPAGGTAVNSPL